MCREGRDSNVQKDIVGPRSRNTAYKLRMSRESIFGEVEIKTVRTKEGEGLEKAMDVSVGEVEGVDAENMKLCEFGSELEKSADDEGHVVVLAAVHIQVIDVSPKPRKVRQGLHNTVKVCIGVNVCCV